MITEGSVKGKQTGFYQSLLFVIKLEKDNAED